MRFFILQILFSLIFVSQSFAGLLEEKNDISIHGINREYYLYIPDTTTGPLPVVFMFHGHNGTALGAINHYQWQSLADQYGILFVFPQALNRPADIDPITGSQVYPAGIKWDIAMPIVEDPINDSEDISFMKEIINKLKQSEDFQISNEHIFFTGHSNGAAWSYYAAMLMRDQVKAFVAHSGGLLSYHVSLPPLFPGWDPIEFDVYLPLEVPSADPAMPGYLIHGKDDLVILPIASEFLAQKMSEKGHPVEIDLLENHGHEWELSLNLKQLKFFGEHSTYNKNMAHVLSGDQIDHLITLAEEYPILTQTWFVSNDICTWAGISCEAAEIKSVDLSNQNLTGPISESFCEINLNDLNLSNNQLSGEIPECILEISQLDLSGNPGLIFPFDPRAICEEVLDVRLEECHALIDLYENTQGETWINKNAWGVSPEVCTWFGVTCKSYSGQKRVHSINLKNNALTGVVKGDFIALDKLMVLNLRGNQISSYDEESLAALINLRTLNLAYNLLDNDLSLFPTLAQLRVLNLRYNQLMGTLPTQLGQMQFLKSIYLHRNLLSGAIPDSIGDLSYLTILYLQNNQLNFLPDTIKNVNLKKAYFRDNDWQNLSPALIGFISGLDPLWNR